MAKTVRVGSGNGGGAIRQAVTMDWHLERAEEVQGHVDEAVRILGQIVHKAGKAGCDVIALPEDCLGLASWEAAHWDEVGEVLPGAVTRMLDVLGGLAASYGMYLVCCSDAIGPGGEVRNTAFFLGRDGHQIGRYHKVCLPAHEQLKAAGEGFPVYRTPELGGVGMAICYDMVFPEVARCLALGGADIIFDPTEGGAAFGAAELSRAAFRTRAVENLTYIVVSWGGWGTDEGSMVITPKGEVVAEEKRPGEVAVADIDPFGGRDHQNWSNGQTDMRARLFRERRPEAFGILAHAKPPLLDRLPQMVPGPPEEIARIVSRAITVGHEQWDRAEEHSRAGRIREATAAYEALSRDYPATWFDRTARERLAALTRA